MVDMFNIGSSGFKQNSYGNIQKIGMTPNGRTVYRVIDSNGEETATCFPPAVTTASSWDTDLIEEVGSAIAEEAKALKVSIP